MSALVASPAAADEGTEVVLEETAELVADVTEPAEVEEVEDVEEVEEVVEPVEPVVEEVVEDPALSLAKVAEEEETEELDAPIIALLVPPDPEQVVEKVEICHATAAHNNPYVINEPNASGDVQGHAGHTGPIWFPGIEEEWGDIIPPFTYEGPGGEELFFPGLNWEGNGPAIFENDCNIPDPELTVTTEACPVHGGTGSVFFFVNFLLLEDYRVTILDSEGVFVDSVTFDGSGEGMFEGSFSLPPGNYEIVFEQLNGDATELDRQLFTIGACPPPPPPPPAPPAPAPVVPVKTLAATGAETAGPLMAGGMIMLLMGGAALLAANRRRWGTSRSE